jgi:hypothetical protein
MRRLRQLVLGPGLLLGLCGLLLFSLAWAQGGGPNGGRQRLILKDGSYQVVSRYQIEGDRVRYLSSERGDVWEEVPYALVDWPATEKWNQEHATSKALAAEPSENEEEREAAELDREERAQRFDQSGRMPMVTAGLRLPDEGGVFVLDHYRGQPELIHLEQANGNLNRDPNHSVLRAAIASLHGAKEIIQIQGEHAAVQLHIDAPVLYVSLDSGPEAPPEDALTVETNAANPSDAQGGGSAGSHYVLVRVDVRRNLRTIEAMRVSLLGKETQSEEIVPANSEILPGRHWMKVTPKYPLDAGEYALMEMLSPTEVNLDVWDFGVNPDAPENAHPVLPIPANPR